MEKDVYSFWKWVETRMDLLGITSYRELETKAGFANGAISRRKNALKFPTVEMAEGICHALRVSWVELWVRAGFIPPSDDSDPYLEILKSLWNLVPEWKKKDVVTQLRATIEEYQLELTEKETPNREGARDDG